MVTKAKTGIPTPSSSKALVSMQDEMQKQLAALAGKTAPVTGAKITITQDKKFKLPDGTMTTELDAVIVDFNSRNEFYSGPFDPNAIAGPVCAAVGSEPDSLVPDDSSPEKKSDNCKTCPENQWGSQGSGKACKNQRYLALLPLKSNADTPIMTLKVSPTAIAGFDGYVQSVANNYNLPPIGVVTKISFNPSKTYASLVFSNPTPNTNLSEHFGRQGEAQAMLAQIPDMTERTAPVQMPRNGRAKAKR